MEDSRIVELYWQKNEDAIKETNGKYGAYCFAIANKTSAVCKTSHLARLNNERTTSKRVLEGLEVFELHCGACDCCGHFCTSMFFIFISQRFST